MAKRARRRQGRPPSGYHGERVQDYERVTCRLPPRVNATLKALSALSGRPAWRVISEAIEAEAARMTGADAKALRAATIRILAARVRAAAERT
jgi:hypothetical protein